MIMNDIPSQERHFEMFRLGTMIQNMIGKATINEVNRVLKLSCKIVDNEKWARWGADNETFLKEMEHKYCEKGETAYEEKS